MVAIEPALECSRAFLLLELYVVATDPVLDTAIERKWSFLLLELFVVVTDPAIILVLDRNLLNSCSLALVLNVALAIFMLTFLYKLIGDEGTSAWTSKTRTELKIIPL